jgi:endonuclease/exonuclease/phosphatase family metal-dependent hydrolase
VPDRAIDHVFSSRTVRMEDVRVLSDAADASDHLPMLLSVTVP